MSQIFNNIFRTFSSMKTGVVILALLALFSAAASTIMPNSFYHLLLFNGLIIILFLNLGFCTFNRLLKLRKLLAKQTDIIKRLRQWGLLILHSGLILILIGGMINSWTGESGAVKLAEGEQTVIALNEQGEEITLLLESFEIELYENNMPSQFLSRVNLYQGDSLQQQAVISVNNPLRYEGIKVYQQSYGSMVDVTIEGQGKVRTHTAWEGQLLDIPGSNRQVKVYKYVPDFDPAYGMETKSMQPNNPRIIYSVYQAEQLLGVGAAPFGDKIPIDEASYVEFNGLKSYSVLKVKEDPGLPYAAAGGILFMLGAALAEINIFSKPRKKNDGTTVEE